MSKYIRIPIRDDILAPLLNEASMDGVLPSEYTRALVEWWFDHVIDKVDKVDREEFTRKRRPHKLRPMKENRTEALHIRMKPSIKRGCEEVSKARGISISQLVEELIFKGIMEDYKDE